MTLPVLLGVAAGCGNGSSPATDASTGLDAASEAGSGGQGGILGVVDAGDSLALETGAVDVATGGSDGSSAHPDGNGSGGMQSIDATVDDRAATGGSDVSPSNDSSLGGNGGMAGQDAAPVVDATIGDADAASSLPDGNVAPDVLAIADAGNPDTGNACIQPGGTCGTGGGCCTGATCVAFPAGNICAANCSTGDGCASGCCVPLAAGGSVCAPASNCATCKRAGEEGCQSNADCCAGSACITELSGGVPTRTVCKDFCTANSACYSGCCAPVQNVTYNVCSTVNYCATPAPAPTSALPYGTYSVVVSREEGNLYKVQGQKAWIKTQLCYQFVYYDNATVAWRGPYSIDSQITFSSGQTCKVVDVLLGQ